MLALTLLLLAWTGLVTAGAVVDGLFALALIGLAMFTLTAAWGLTLHRGAGPRGAAPHRLRHH
jgi:hypothetical protein